MRLQRLQRNLPLRHHRTPATRSGIDIGSALQVRCEKPALQVPQKVT